jgi:branched-chain amino acid transport system substrate-binding protein
MAEGVLLKRYGIAFFGLSVALVATPAFADITVCIWGTITGPDAVLNGQSYGARDYLTFLNQTQGGIANNRTRVLLLDGRYKLDEELKIYRRCVEQEEAVVINGWSTGAAKALRDQITQDKVPYIANSYAAEIIDPQRLPFAFIAGPTYEQQIVIGLREAAAHGAKTALLMHADNEYGRAPVNNVKNSGVIEKLGLKLLDTIEFQFDVQDMTAQMLRAKSLDPDVIYVQGSGQNLIVILRDAAKVGFPAKKIVANVFNILPAIPDQLGAAAEGFRAIQVYSPFGSDIPASNEISAFAEKNEILKKDTFYMKGWLLGKVMAAAISRAVKKSGGKIPSSVADFRQATRDEMEGLKDLDVGGIVPPMTYSDHQGTVRARIAEVQGGKFVPVGNWIDPR